MNTTTAPSLNICGYCGNYHSYSYQMCRDMVTKPFIPIEPKVNGTLCPSVWQVLPWKIKWNPYLPVILCIFCKGEAKITAVTTIGNEISLSWECDCTKYKKFILRENEEE